jgi:FkbM family methyltransferase
LKLFFHLEQRTRGHPLRLRLGRGLRRIVPRFDLLQTLNKAVGRSTKLEIMGKTLYADLDLGAAGGLFEDGKWELDEIGFVQRFLKEGMIFADLGANIGYYTIVASEKVGTTGKVFAFEPDRRNFALLRKNIKQNGCRNVVPVQKTVTSQSGSLRLYLSKSNLGAHRVFASESEVAGPSRRIESVSLDQFFPNGSRVDFLKMDIEGAEYSALLGMKRVLTDNPHIVILTEFSPYLLRQSGVAPLSFLHEIRGFGFSIFALDGQTTREVSDDMIMHMPGNMMNLICSRSSLLA